jgi:hypothetical protein
VKGRVTRATRREEAEVKTDVRHEERRPTPAERRPHAIGRVVREPEEPALRVKGRIIEEPSTGLRSWGRVVAQGPDATG